MLKRYYSRRSFFRRVLSGALALGLARAQAGKPWPQGFVLQVAFAYEGGGFRYRAPYVAAYVEDERGNLVKTLALFLMPGKGERWWDALRRYYLLGDVAAMRTLSGPTRPRDGTPWPGTAPTIGEEGDPGRLPRLRGVRPRARTLRAFPGEGGASGQALPEGLHPEGGAQGGGP